MECMLACSTELLTQNHNDCRLARNRFIARRRNLHSLIGNFRQRQIMAARSEESDLFLNKDPSIAALVIIYFLKYHSRYWSGSLVRRAQSHPVPRLCLRVYVGRARATSQSPHEERRDVWEISENFLFVPHFRTSNTSESLL